MKFRDATGETATACAMCPERTPTDAATSVAEPHRGRVRSIFRAGVGLAVALALAAILAGWQQRLHGRTALLSAELRALETQLAMLSQERQEAERARAALAALRGQRDRVAEDRDEPRWTDALRRIATAGGANVEWEALRARSLRDDRGACELRIEGACTGREPRTTADRYRRELEAQLDRHFHPEGVTIHFERLEDEPPSPSSRPDRRRAKFTIVATTGAKEQPARERSAGR
jgi:hypothetical protein